MPKHRRVAEERAPPAAAPSDVAESSRRVGGAGSQSPEEIPVGEPIVPPYNGSKALPFARVLHEVRTASASPELRRQGSQVIACWRRLGHCLLPSSWRVLRRAA